MNSRLGAWARWRVAAGLLLLVIAPIVSAQGNEARRYAVVSLIADRLEIVSYVEQTSSRLDQHVRLDVTASQAVSAARNQDNTDPWGALSQGEKMQLLASLVAREVQARLPGLLKPP